MEDLKGRPLCRASTSNGRKRQELVDTEDIGSACKEYCNVQEAYSSTVSHSNSSSFFLALSPVNELEDRKANMPVYDGGGNEKSSMYIARDITRTRGGYAVPSLEFGKPGVKPRFPSDKVGNHRPRWRYCVMTVLVCALH